jgi:hypothetical protein
MSSARNRGVDVDDTIRLRPDPARFVITTLARLIGELGDDVMSGRLMVAVAARSLMAVAARRRGRVDYAARELVEFARHHGYRADELINIIESVAYPTETSRAASGTSSSDPTSPPNGRARPRRRAEGANRRWVRRACRG